MKDALVEVGVTCGIEFEFDDIPQKSSKISIKNWRLTHDASCESDVINLNGIPVKGQLNQRLESLIPQSRKETAGGEMVSCILNTETEDIIGEIKKLTNVFSELGESEEGKRSGIHYHFSIPSPNLRILKAILRLGKYLEALFFTIGGMGYEFRGVENDATYCRPITKFGPPCIRTYHGKYAQVFNIYELLKVKTQEDFWERYGDLKNHVGRYNPVRYTWLNLYPMCPWADYKGTLEFRIFNKTLNPFYIYATLMLCKKFVEYSFVSSFDTLKDVGLLKENSIYNTSITKGMLFEQLSNFKEMTGLDDYSFEILAKILDRSPIPKLNQNYIHTHLRSGGEGYWGRSEYAYPVISENLIVRPNFVDIHTLRGER